MLRTGLALILLLTLVESSQAGTACDAVEGFDYRGAKIRKIPASQAYFYTITRMAIDADGAPNAYHPLDKGIDALANAGASCCQAESLTYEVHADERYWDN